MPDDMYIHIMIIIIILPVEMEVSSNQILVWMRQFFTEDEIRRVKNSDEDHSSIEQKNDHKVDLRDFIRPIDADELEKVCC